MPDHLLLPIKSEHALNIYEGAKRAELRKSFTCSSSPIIFLYEVSPIGAVTGFMVSSKRLNLPVEECVAHAAQLGINEQRSAAYYGNREKGWVIEIEEAFRFGEPIKLRELQEINHYFRVPQGFGYLNKYDALTHRLVEALQDFFRNSVSLKRCRTKADMLLFKELIFSTVGMSYEDIDDDFVQQNLDAGLEDKAAFSTKEKRVLAISVHSINIGYTVVTLKKSCAFKTGPTVLFPKFRGLGVGTIIRLGIEEYCKKNGAFKVYCTCPVDKPHIVSYLLNSGLRLEAVLSRHLSTLRDELVFGKLINPLRMAAAIPPCKKQTLQEPVRAQRYHSDQGQPQKLTKFLREVSPICYFPLSGEDIASVIEGASNYESGNVSYSAKPRKIYTCVDKSGRIVGVGVLTFKRSSMIKLNLFFLEDLYQVATELIEKVKTDNSSRRYYVTISTLFSSVALALINAGFKYEGTLCHPFGGTDHFCLGMTK